MNNVKMTRRGKRDSLIKKANQALKLNNLALAQNTYEELCDYFPQQPFGTLGLIRVAIVRKEYDKALQQALYLINRRADNKILLQSIIEAFKRSENIDLIVQVMVELDNYQKRPYHVLFMTFLRKLFYLAPPSLIQYYFKHDGCRMSRELMIFGDSHSGVLYHIGNLNSRAGRVPSVFGLFASTISGFIKDSSYLNTYPNFKKIIEAINPAVVLLKFGQVDVDFGMYYRSVVKGVSVEPKQFFSAMIDNYLSRLETFSATRMIVCGINMPTIEDQDLAVEVVGSKICRRLSGNMRKKYMKKLSKILPTYEQRVEMSLLFNSLLRSACNKKGIEYIDYTAQFLTKEGSIPNCYKREKDHHYRLTQKESLVCWELLQKKHNIRSLECLLNS